MTATYSLPSSISKGDRFRSKPVDPNRIKVVIPTYKDWEGLKTTLESLMRMETPPSSIVVANDNPEPDVPGWVKTYPVEVKNYKGNRGPAFARNAGFGFLDLEISSSPSSELRMRLSSIGGRKERATAKSLSMPNLSVSQFGLEPRTFEWDGKEDWVYFTDCGCEHAPDLFEHFASAWVDYGDSCAALSGAVLGSGKGAINEYMTEQGVLNPPLEQMINGVYIPQAIITANALVASLPFAYIGGFDTKFKEAAGEDLDLGIRLRELGVIGWAPLAQVAHRFDEDEADFVSRFKRYGRGNRALEIKHQLPSLRAKPFKPEIPDNLEHVRLAEVALTAMQEGYDEAIDHSQRGKIREY